LQNIPTNDGLSEQQRQGELARPRIITIASWIWIVCSSLFLLLFLFVWFGPVPLWDILLRQFAKYPALLLGNLLEYGVRIGFLYAGVRTLRGRAHGTLVSGLCSVSLGLLLLLSFFMRPSLYALPDVGALLAAGILALLGRRKYKAWRAARDELLAQQHRVELARPRIITIAGWVWIIDGGLDLLLLASCAISGAIPDRFAMMDQFPTSFVTRLAPVVLGIGFLFVGVQTVRGRARDTLFSGLGAIVIGLLPFLLAFNSLTLGLLRLLDGGTLLAAGILALLGRREYKAWRAARKADQAEKQRT
jgi:hypothetical protein